MAGALYDVFSIHNVVNLEGVAAGVLQQGSYVAPAGKRILSFHARVDIPGGFKIPLPMDKYEFGVMGADPDSEGVWWWYKVPTEYEYLGAEMHLLVTVASETNP
jgi:hypothetical protein